MAEKNASHQPLKVRFGRRSLLTRPWQGPVAATRRTRVEDTHGTARARDACRVTVARTGFVRPWQLRGAKNRPRLIKSFLINSVGPGFLAFRRGEPTRWGRIGRKTPWRQVHTRLRHSHCVRGAPSPRVAAARLHTAETPCHH